MKTGTTLKCCDSRSHPVPAWRIEGGTVKSIVISAAALAVVGGAAGGITAIAPPSGVAHVQLAAVGAPRPQDPAAAAGARPADP